ncbi:alanine racemase [Nocardia sp. NPDC003345]
MGLTGADAPAGAGTEPPDGYADTVAAPVPAHRDLWEQRILADPRFLGDIAFAVGGPFHLMYPPRVVANIRAFQDVFTRHGVTGAVYYGKKANKAACVARACATAGAGVDIASTGELLAALGQGVTGPELMVTGPEKSGELHWLAARHGCLVAVDSIGELERLAAVDIPVRVLLRALPPASASRFGMTEGELDHAMAATTGFASITLEGFSFHLSGYDAGPRAELAGQLLRRCLAARTQGHPATVVSVGGGFGVDYVPAAGWSDFHAGVNRRWFHSGRGFESYYPYHFPEPGPEMLAAILASDDLAGRLRRSGTTLAIEPGRALLDRAGSTVFRVQGSKVRHEHGRPYRILTVDGSSLSLSEQWFGSEYLPDPVLWPEGPGVPTPTVVGAATCLESDMLSWRRIPLPRPAADGDLLVYPNTAGYQMDSNESPFHELPLPPKVVLSETSDGRYRWALDHTCR